MKTHPATHQTCPKCHSVTIHILWRVHGVGVVGWLVGGFMGWVGVWWWGGWLESSWMGEYMHLPHPGVLGVMGGWVWV